MANQTHLFHGSISLIGIITIDIQEKGLYNTHNRFVSSNQVRKGCLTMKNPLRIRFAALFGATALLLSACGVDITSVGLPSDMTLSKGESRQLEVEFGANDNATSEAIAKAAEGTRPT